MRESKIKSLQLSKEQGLLAISFFSNGYQDYLAARTLILKGLLSQGVVLSNTAIEKYFKGILTIVNVPVPKKHDVSTKRYVNTLKSHFRRLYNLINWEFISFIAESYKIRYTDDLDVGFNLVIARLKTLAELDFLVAQIEESFTINFLTKRRRFHSDIENKNSVLLDFNYYLQKIDKTDFIERIDLIKQYGLISKRILLEVEYTTKEVKNDGKFLYKGMANTAEDPELRIVMCFTPFTFETI